MFHDCGIVSTWLGRNRGAPADDAAAAASAQTPATRRLFHTAKTKLEIIEMLQAVIIFALVLPRIVLP